MELEKVAKLLLIQLSTYSCYEGERISVGSQDLDTSDLMLQVMSTIVGRYVSWNEYNDIEKQWIKELNVAIKRNGA